MRCAVMISMQYCTESVLVTVTTGELMIIETGVSAEERPIIGQLANEIREKLTNEIESQKKKLEEVKLEAQMQAEAVDAILATGQERCGN